MHSLLGVGEENLMQNEVTDERLVIVPIPALVAILLHSAKEKGSPLTESEVLAIRDQATCITMSYSMAADMVEKRGYDDVRPENVWEDWSAIYPSLIL
ncbi:hypothetical protein [Sphingomonas sp. Leaf205]|uniref:hypothetical protein n=1 Tax=Sphingomonas sp. Leaf205 TaxID=2876551 RepID=UPI001E652104|nr:hypothetical protein [Sphingomonas sp. Leaf205]